MTDGERLWLEALISRVDALNGRDLMGTNRLSFKGTVDLGPDGVHDVGIEWMVGLT